MTDTMGDRRQAFGAGGPVTIRPLHPSSLSW
jgi:hypothetical protein